MPLPRTFHVVLDVDAHTIMLHDLQPLYWVQATDCASALRLVLDIAGPQAADFIAYIYRVDPPFRFDRDMLEPTISWLLDHMR